jgi:glycosyltransferase involved in cell wall biosynthesis
MAVSTVLRDRVGIYFMQRRLLLVNYCIDPNDPSLAHQYEVLLGLAENFEKVTVITTRNTVRDLPANIEVHVLPWTPQRSFLNSFRLFWVALVTLIKHKPSHVFTHMLPKHATIVGLITKPLGIRHVLWYAHASKPISLSFANFFVSGIATSSSGSCPLHGPKVRCIGQGIDRGIFQRTVLSPISKKNFLYVGRMDQSKNVQLIIDTLEVLRAERQDIKLTLIGNNASTFINGTQKTWIVAKNSIPRNELGKEFGMHDVFIHAFLGSLDKVLIEATLVGLPVLTINSEYLNEFIPWSSNHPTTLLNQVTGFYEKSQSELNYILDHNYSVAVSRHEIEGWVKRLTEFIVSA